MSDPVFGTSPLSFGTLFVYDETTFPTEFRLKPAYPNPFNPVTNIEFGLPFDSFVELLVYDIKGRIVSELVNKKLQAGWHTIQWDAAFESSGLYIVKLTAENYQQTQKIIVLK